MWTNKIKIDISQWNENTGNLLLLMISQNNSTAYTCWKSKFNRKKHALPNNWMSMHAYLLYIR